MSKVLVTGGAGFIGSHLADYLLEGNHEVIAVDNFYTGSKNNLQHLKNHKNFKLVDQDINQPFDVGAVDQIYNLACPASPVHYVRDPLFTIKTNTQGMINMLEYAKKYQAKILQASTSEVYGDPLSHPQAEAYWGNVNLLGPRACYDEGKRLAETLCYNYKNIFNLDVKIVRIFNTYGPRMAYDDGRALPNFIKQCLLGEELTVYGRGKQTRSLMYVADLVKGLVKMMSLPNYLGPVNLGNPDKELSMLGLAKLVAQTCQVKPKIVYRALPQNDPLKRRPDISLAKKELAWVPEIGLKQGLKLTIEDFRLRLKV